MHTLNTCLMVSLESLNHIPCVKWFMGTLSFSHIDNYGW
jgi:hypothetical protein